MNYYYHNLIALFISNSTNEIIGALTKENQFDGTFLQNKSWEQQIPILKTALHDLSGEIYFEFSIPRMGKRILEEKTRKCETVLVSDIKHFELRYAKPKRYYWTIPICAAYPLIHGFYAALTIPIHLIVTTIVTATGEAAFKYRDEGITYENLRMFARFPQGIPPGVELADIKWNMPAR